MSLLLVFSVPSAVGGGAVEYELLCSWSRSRWQWRIAADGRPTETETTGEGDDDDDVATSGLDLELAAVVGSRSRWTGGVSSPLEEKEEAAASRSSTTGFRTASLKRSGCTAAVDGSAIAVVPSCSRRHGSSFSPSPLAASSSSPSSKRRSGLCSSVVSPRAAAAAEEG